MPSGVYIRTDDYRKKLSEAMKGHKVSVKTKLKIGKANSISLLGHKHSEESKNKRLETRYNNGKPWHSENTIEKIKLSNLGKKRSLKTRKNISISMSKRMKNSKERQKISKTVKLNWDNMSPEDKSKFILKSFGKVKQFPNSKEKLLYSIINKLFPKQYKLNIKSEVRIDGLKPDIINISGQNKVIEHFGTYWHEKRKETSREIEESNKINRYLDNGYKCLVIWEDELSNIETLTDKLWRFNNE